MRAACPEAAATVRDLGWRPSMIASTMSGDRKLDLRIYEHARRSSRSAERSRQCPHIHRVAWRASRIALALIAVSTKCFDLRVGPPRAARNKNLSIAWTGRGIAILEGLPAFAFVVSIDRRCGGVLAIGFKYV